GPLPAKTLRRARWRSQSEPACACKRWAGCELTWSLRASSKAPTSAPAGHPASWQTESALASVRDPAALAKLPDAEREQWQRLWTDVAALVVADPLEQGRAHAAGGDWAKAADCYARALTRGPTDDGHFWFEYAAVLLLSG